MIFTWIRCSGSKDARWNVQNYFYERRFCFIIQYIHRQRRVQVPAAARCRLFPYIHLNTDFICASHVCGGINPIQRQIWANTWHQFLDNNLNCFDLVVLFSAFGVNQSHFFVIPTEKKHILSTTGSSANAMTSVEGEWKCCAARRITIT